MAYWPPLRREIHSRLSIQRKNKNWLAMFRPSYPQNSQPTSSNMFVATKAWFKAWMIKGSHWTQEGWWRRESRETLFAVGWKWYFESILLLDVVIQAAYWRLYLYLARKFKSNIIGCWVHACWCQEKAKVVEKHWQGIKVEKEWVEMTYTWHVLKGGCDQGVKMIAFLICRDIIDIYSKMWKINKKTHKLLKLHVNLLELTKLDKKLVSTSIRLIIIDHFYFPYYC